MSDELEAAVERLRLDAEAARHNGMGTERVDEKDLTLALDALAEAQQWHPVDSPPKAGVPVILLMENRLGNRFRIRAEYSDGMSLEVNEEIAGEYGTYDEEADTFWCPVGWFESNYYEETHWEVTGTPLLWHELPEVPNA